jgi:hypothetical protein
MLCRASAVAWASATFAFAWHSLHGLSTWFHAAPGVAFMVSVGRPHNVSPGNASRCHVRTAPAPSCCAWPCTHTILSGMPMSLRGLWGEANSGPILLESGPWQMILVQPRRLTIEPHLGRRWARPVRVGATRAALSGVAIAGLIAISGLVGLPASAASRAIPTHEQIEGCVKAVTGDKPLTARQVTGCRAAVSQTFLSEKCPQNPSGYLIDLMGYRGVHGKAAHEWAIRAGRRPFLVRSDQTTQDVLDAAICG